MFKKKKIEFVPDGDDYADDPFVYTTRRGLTHEKLARHWKVRASKGGDVKSQMDRQFSPWFLEKEKEKNIEDDMTWGQIFKRRFKLYTIKFFTTSLYDYVYLLLLLAMVVSIPAYEAQIGVDRPTIALLPQAMTLMAAIPVVGALIVKFFMFNFISTNCSEKQVRFWGLFFFITLKVTHFQNDILPKMKFKIPLKMKKKKGAGGGSKVVAEGEGGGGGGEKGT